MHKLELAEKKFQEAKEALKNGDLEKGKSLKLEAIKLREEAELEIEIKEVNQETLQLKAPNRNLPLGEDTSVPQNKESTHQKAFSKYIQKGEGSLTQKELSTIRDNDGGVFVHEEFGKEIIKELRDEVEIMKHATVKNTKSGHMAFPTYDYDPTINNVAENATVSDMDVSNAFGKTSFSVHKKKILIKVPIEMLEDGAEDALEVLLEDIRDRFGEELEDDFINGTGNGESLGLLQANLSATDLTSSATDINTKSVLEAPREIKKQYRRNAVYIMSRAQAQKLDSLLDSDGRPLFKRNQSLLEGAPDILNGYPLIEVERMTAPSADGDCAFIFGDLKKYWIVKKKDISVKRLDELYAEQDQVGFMVSMRLDAAPVLQAAFKRYNRN